MTIKQDKHFKSVVAGLLLLIGTLSTVHSAFALDAVGEGRRAWLKFNCYGCHGMRAGGGMGPNLAGEGGEVSEAVLSGEGGGMPSYKGIVTLTDVSNLAAYLRSINTAGEPTFLHWWEVVPSR